MYYRSIQYILLYIRRNVHYVHFVCTLYFHLWEHTFSTLHVLHYPFIQMYSRSIQNIQYYIGVYFMYNISVCTYITLSCVRAYIACVLCVDSLSLTLSVHVPQGYSSWVCLCAHSIFSICKIASSQSHTCQIHVKATRALVSHFACPRWCTSVYLDTWCCFQLRHCVCASLCSAHAYLTGRWLWAASGVRSPKGRYVLSAVLHAPEEGSQGFSTLVPPL